MQYINKKPQVSFRVQYGGAMVHNQQFVQAKYVDKNRWKEIKLRGRRMFGQ